MFQVIIKSLFVCIVFCVTLGKTLPNNDGKIIGGDLVEDITKYPSMCSLRYMNDHTCGCVIISENYVLSAAHCVRVLVISSLSIHVGTTHINGGGQNYEIERVIEHPDFIISDLSTPDLVIVTLPFPFVFTSGVQPAKLPSQIQETPAGSPAIATGWGFSAESPPVNPTLLEVELVVRDHDECSAVYSSELNITAAQICADVPEGGKGVCTHDAGGPLYVNGEVHGIISRNINGCGQPGFPDVFVRVASFRDWITENTGV